MSDQGFYQRGINLGDTAQENFTAAGSIQSTSTVATADTSAGAYTILLPEQEGSAGATITVVSVDGANVLTVGVQTGDNLNGIVNGSAPLAAAPLTFAVFTSTGTNWVRIV